MALKSFRPITPVQRYKQVNMREQLTNDAPHHPLLVAKRKHGGRNANGRITVRHHGGGNKRYYRIVDFARTKRNIPGVVETIEYDPNRSAFIALVKFQDGERRYILATTNLKVGQRVLAGEQAEIAEGNCVPLKNVPDGTMVCNIEIRVGKGGQVARGAGSYAVIVAKENNMVQLRFPSTEMRNVSERCFATIGQISNIEHMNVVFGSAGRRRHMGWRPHVRGMCMNPIDHPMGGGEGRSKSGGGRHHPVSPWGQKAKGLKTRKRKKASSQFIVRRRSK
jgi:large subunit ribosomal protein L2